MEKLISVIVPVYNTENYVRKCVDSIINQSYRNLEIILVDDGSTDSSGEICDEYSLADSRVKVIHQSNKGAAAAKNSGLKVRKGDYVSFVDSDDWIDKDMYTDMAGTLEKSGADFAICEKWFATKGDLSASRKNCISDPDRVIMMNKDDAFDRILQYSSVLCDKLFTSEIIGDDLLDPNLTWGEDVRYLLKILNKINTVCVLPRKYYYFYLDNREGNVSSADMSDRDIEHVDNAIGDYRIIKNYGYECAAIDRLRRVISGTVSRIPPEKSLNAKYREYFNKCLNAARIPGGAEMIKYYRNKCYMTDHKIWFMMLRRFPHFLMIGRRIRGIFRA